MKKSNKRLDFLPNRQNKYSIRKFTVGTASILVGAILLFGAQNDAQAEEAPAESASSTTETKALDVSPVEASTAEVAPTAPTETTEATSTEETTEPTTTEPTTTEPTTTETSTTETTTEEATAEEATSETKPAASTETPASTEEATTEPASAEPTTTESSTTEPVTAEPATTEQPSKEATTSNEVTSEAPSTESAPAESTQEAPSAPSTLATESPAVDAPAITSEATAVDYVANTTSLSSAEAETLVSDLNLDYNNLTPEELQAALIDGLVAQQNATATEATPLDRRQTSALSDIDSVTYGTTAFRAAVTPETALADNATYQPYAKQEPTNYRYGTVGDATEAIANTAELPADTQYTFKDNTVFQRVGNQLATVVATYADGTTDEVLAPIYVSYAYEKDGVSYSGVPYSAENNFTRTEEDVHIAPNLEDLSSTESRADNTIDFDLSAVFNLVRVNSGMETYIELDERIAQYVTSIDGNIASTAAGTSPDRPFVWERVVNAKGELTNTWKMRSFNALAYSDGETSVFIGDQPSVSQVSSSTINLSDTVENIFANDPLLQNGDLAFRTYTLTEEGQIVNTTDRTNYFQVALDEKDTLTEATALTERNWFTGSGAITHYEAQAGNNGGIVFDQYFNKSSNGTLNGYGSQPNRDWTYNFEIDPRLLPYIDDVEIHYLDENGVDWTASTELSDRFANESTYIKNEGWDNFEYRFNDGTSIESAYTTDTTWNDTRDGAVDKEAYTVPDVELQPGQGYMTLDAVLANVDSRQLNFRPGLIQPAKVRVVATLKDGVSINDVLGQNRDENFGFTGYLVNGKNEIIPNTAGTGYYQAMDVDGDGIVDEIDPSIETPDAPPQTADNFTPVGQPIETPVGVTPDPRDGITNLGELPPDATYNWEVVPNVDTPTTPGNPIQAAVIVTYVDGSQDRVEVPITVTDTPVVTPPEAPVVTNPQPNDGTVTGTSNEPGGTVTVTFPNGDTATGTVGEDGTWTVDVPPTETLEQGEVITATITDDNGNTSTPGSGTVTDTIAPDAPVVTNPQPNDGTVTGTSNEPGGTVTVTFPNGDVVTGTVGEDGTWTVDVPPTTTLTEGDIITATVEDDNGNVSTPGNGTVTDTIAPEAPVVNNPQPNAGTVTGTSNEPGGTVTVTFPNGDVVTGTVGEDGTWTVDVPPTTTLTEGDIITATVEDDNGNVSTPGNGTVTDTIAPDAPVVNDPQPNDGTVTGSGEPGGTVVVTFPNGDVVTGTVGEDGTWTVNVPPTETLEEGEVVTAVITDDNGNTSTPGNGTVTDTIAPEAPVVNNPQPNDGTVTGSGEPGGTVVVTFPNGDVVTGTVGEDGTWTVNVPPTETLEEGEVVTAVITDDNGNTSTPGNGTVTDTIAPDAPVVNNSQPNDGTVTGSGEPGGTVVVTFPNGDVVTGTVGEDGTWTVDVPPTETLEEGEVVTAVVTDDNGNTSTPGNGTVTDTIAPEAPVVNNPQPNDGTVTGTGEPGGTVTVTFPNGEVVTGTVGEDGTWTVDVPPTVTLTEGDVITATVEDDNGNVSTPGNGTVTDTIAPDAPVVNNPQPNDGTVTGTGEPGGTVTVTFPNGEVVTGTVGEDGTWTVDVPPTVTLTEGDVITATVEDDNGNVSTPGNGTVTDTIAPDAPVVNNPQPNDGTVTGTGEPGGTVTVTFPNGEVVTGTVGEDGTWTVDVPPTVTLTEGDIITATVEDDNGNVSTPGNGTVTDTIAPDTPVVNNPQPNDGTVTGTGEPGGTVTVTFPNGEVVTGTVEEDGTWTVDVPPTVTLTEGDVITATVEDDNGNVSTPGNGTVTDTIAPEAPVVNNPQPNDGTVTGTGEPGGTVTVTFPNGEVVTGTVDEDGTWTVDVPPTVTLTEGDIITATVEDDNGNVSTPGNGTVTDTIAPDAPVVNNPQPNDGTVTGTGEPGGTVTVTFPNGEVVTGTVEEDGTWTVDVPPTVTLTEGDVITATVEDDNGNVSTPGNGTVTDTIAPDAPVVNNPQPNDGTVTGTGEPGGTVTVTFPNGEVVTGTVDEDGTWTVDVPPTVTLTEGDIITATVEDDNGNVSTPGNGTVTDTIAPDAPVVNNPQPNDGTVTGTGEPGGTVTVTFPNGEVVTGTVGEDGTWTVDVPPTVTLTEGDVITATVEDDNGNVSTPGNGTVTDTIAPEPPVVDPIKPGDTVVTGEGEPGGTVTVTFPNGDVVTGTVGEDGTWTVDVPPTVTIKDGDTIVVTQTDKGGNESDSTTVVVTGDKDDSTTPPVDNNGNNDGNNDCPVVKPIQNNDTSVTGQTEPGAPVKVEFPGDTTVTTEADDEGQFTVSVPQHVALNDGDTVKVTGSEDKPATAKVGELPETGSTTNPTLFGGLIAALGSLFLFGRRRKEKEEQ